MPVVIVEGLKMKDLEAKRKLVTQLTDTVARVYQVPERVVVVLIKENSLENVGAGGVLLSDAP